MNSQEAASLRKLLTLGFVALAIATAAWSWGLLARQAWSSSWHVSGYPSAIDALAIDAFFTALLVFALAPRAWEQGLAAQRALRSVVLMSAWSGSLLVFSLEIYAAKTGQLAVQFYDALGTLSWLTALRVVGGLLRATSVFLTAFYAIKATASPARAHDE